MRSTLMNNRRNGAGKNNKNQKNDFFGQDITNCSKSQMIIEWKQKKVDVSRKARMLIEEIDIDWKKQEFEFKERVEKKTDKEEEIIHFNSQSLLKIESWSELGKFLESYCKCEPSFMPSKLYLLKNKLAISEQHMTILVDWLIGTIERIFNVKFNPVFEIMNKLKLFLWQNEGPVLTINHLQTWWIACIYWVLEEMDDTYSKMFEQLMVTFSEKFRMSEVNYWSDRIKKTLNRIDLIADRSVEFISQRDFFTWMSKLWSFNTFQLNLGWYYLEWCLYEIDCLIYNPSLLAFSTWALVNKLTTGQSWNENFDHLSSLYSMKDAQRWIQSMFFILQKIDKSMKVYRKYSLSKYSEVAHFWIVKQQSSSKNLSNKELSRQIWEGFAEKSRKES